MLPFQLLINFSISLEISHEEADLGVYLAGTLDRQLFAITMFELELELVDCSTYLNSSSLKTNYLELSCKDEDKTKDISLNCVLVLAKCRKIVLGK